MSHICLTLVIQFRVDERRSDKPVKKSLHVRIDAALADDLIKAAERQEISVSDYVRRCLIEKIANDLRLASHQHS